jgi:hypothetical protein
MFAQINLHSKVALILMMCLSSWQLLAWPGMPLPPLHVDGRYLKDNCGNKVLLHGVAITPNPWFNGCQYGFSSQYCSWDNYNVQGALDYNKKVMDRLTNTADGWYLNYIRLHVDPYWSNDPGPPIPEHDISRFNYNRLVTYTDQVIIPLVNHAKERGMYVILRPPGVCPERIAVGDAYHLYLKTVWTFLSQHPGLKNVDHVMFELANEPVQILGTNGVWGATSNEHFAALKNFFQPLVDIIRGNGSSNVCWIPGTGWQSHYQGYVNYQITGGNVGYAVHIYPAFWGGVRNYTAFLNAWNTNVKPIADVAPIAITETDWAPNGGAFGVATTGTAGGEGFGANLKYIADQSGNVSWNLLSPDNLLDHGDPNGVIAYNNNWEACAAPVKQWFSEYSGASLPVLNCNGEISYRLRARSTDGAGSVNIKIGDETIATFILNTTMSDYAVNSALNGAISVEFDNDDIDRDVRIDYLSVNGQLRQAEDQKYNSGVKQNSGCGGSYSEWLHCNGSIVFGSTLNGSGVITSVTQNAENKKQRNKVEIYPNPSSTGDFMLRISDCGQALYRVEIYSIAGKQLYQQNGLTMGENYLNSNLRKGIYIIRTNCGKHVLINKICVE